jgi:membrane protein implicated in regulation of membrane protease activity
VAGQQPSGKSDAWGGLAAVGGIALVIGCCGAVPLVAALAGSIAVGAVLGIAVGAAALTVLVALLLLRRRRRACETPKRSLPSAADEAREREVVR